MRLAEKDRQASKQAKCKLHPLALFLFFMRCVHRYYKQRDTLRPRHSATWSARPPADARRSLCSGAEPAHVGSSREDRRRIQTMNLADNWPPGPRWSDCDRPRRWLLRGSTARRSRGSTRAFARRSSCCARRTRHGVAGGRSATSSATCTSRVPRPRCACMEALSRCSCEPWCFFVASLSFHFFIIGAW